MMHTVRYARCSTHKRSSEGTFSEVDTVQLGIWRGKSIFLANVASSQFTIAKISAVQAETLARHLLAYAIELRIITARP